MVLDLESDFEKLRKKTNRPVHWIQHNNNGEFSWVRTLGEITTIQTSLKVSEQVKLTENEFLEDIHANVTSDRFRMPILLADSPGMGKSILLAKLGTQLQEKYPERLVVFLVINEFISSVHARKMDWKICKEDTDNYLAEHCCKNQLGKMIFKDALHTENTKIELMLDGFDEIHVDQRDMAFAYLKILQSNYKTLRVWLTTRTHMTQELEMALQVLSFRIAPFELNEQIDCLVNLWKSPLTCIERLKHYAEVCLQHLQQITNSEDSNIAGIPLQCRMIAEVHEHEAQDYSTDKSWNYTDSSRSPVIPYNSITQLYQKMFNKKYVKYASLQNKGECWSKQTQVEEHMRFAVSLLFPSTQVYEGSSGATQKIFPSDHVIQLGIIIQFCNEGYAFIHRTFAEFFLAGFVLKLLKGEPDDSALEFILADILDTQQIELNISFLDFKVKAYQFTNEVTCYFINNLIPTDSNNISKMFRGAERKLSLEQLSQKTSAAIFHNFAQMFLMFEAMEKFQLNVERIIRKNDIFTAVMKAQKLLVGKVLEHGKQVKGKPPHQLILVDESFNRISLLDVAVERREFSIFDFLLKEQGFENCVREFPNMYPDLLEHCCIVTEADRAVNIASIRTSFITEKVQSMRALLRLNPRMIDTWTKILLLTENYYNVEFMQELISHCNHGVSVAHHVQQTIFHWVCSFSRVEDILPIVRKIPTEKARVLVSMRNQEGSTPLLTIVGRNGVDRELLEWFKEHGADFNINDAQGNSICTVAIQSEQKELFLEALLECGTDLKSTLLHNAARCGNLDAIRLLLNKGVSVNGKDAAGETPLSHICKYARYAGNLEDIGRVLINAGGEIPDVEKLNENGESLLHSAIDNGALGGAKILIRVLGANVNKTDNKLMTPLHRVMAKINCWFREDSTRQFVKLLLENGADVNALDGDKCTPLELALKTRSKVLDFLDFYQQLGHLCNKQVAESVLNWIIMDAFPIANESSWDDLFTSCIISAGAEFTSNATSKYSLLHFAARWGYLKAINCLADRGDSVNQVDRKQQTPLFAALESNSYRYNCLDAVTLLVNKGANLKHKDSKGVTPFRYAILENRWDVVRYLLELNPTETLRPDDFCQVAAKCYDMDAASYICSKYREQFLNSRTKEGDTLLHVAVKNGNSTVCEHLLETADFEKQLHEPFMQDLVHHCISDSGPASYRKSRILKLLASKNSVLINAPDSEGNPPILSLHNTSHIVFKTLVEYGADLNAITSSGDNPAHRIVVSTSIMRYQDLLYLINIDQDELLLARGENGNTVLHQFVKYCNLRDSLDDVREMLKVFRCIGADFNAVNNDGESILATAKANCPKKIRDDVMRTLINLGASNE